MAISPQLKHYYKIKNSGLCVVCKTASPRLNSFRCDKCAIKTNKLTKRCKDERPEGVCRQCLVRPAVENLSSCQECRSRQAQKSAEQHKKLRLDIINLYGNQCVCCKNNNIKYLQLDHKNNDGNVERASLPPSTRGGKFFKYVLEQYKKSGEKREDLQILCANCHNAKRYGGCTTEDHL